MALFIKQIADKLAGQVAFSLPNGNGGYNQAVGFLAEHPTIRMGNKWDSLISDLSTINEFTQLANWGASSWVSTSKAAWKGTDPITVGLEFYLITYLKSQVDGTGKNGAAPISQQASYFARLAALSEENNDTGWFKSLRVGVHGGYHPDYFTDNKDVFHNGDVSSFLSGDKDKSNVQLVEGDSKGTCHIVINGNGMNSVVLTDMLLETLEMTPSTVRAGYWNGIANKGISQQATFKASAEPLYIKMSTQFRLARVATVDDVRRLFGGKYGV